MMDYQAATNKALEHIKKAIPHIDKAMQCLADALQIDPDEVEELPLTDTAMSKDHFKAARLFENVWQAHLHCTDHFGS